MMGRRSQFGLADTRWMDGAACVGHDPALWTTEHDAEKVDRAAAICATCTVILECDAFIRSLPPADRWGVYGGLHWIGGARPARRVPGRCRYGHPRQPGSRYCYGCDAMVGRAAEAMGVGLKEYAQAFGKSARVAHRVLKELGAS